MWQTPEVGDPIIENCRVGAPKTGWAVSIRWCCLAQTDFDNIAAGTRRDLRRAMARAIRSDRRLRLYPWQLESP